MVPEKFLAEISQEPLKLGFTNFALVVPEKYVTEISCKELGRKKWTKGMMGRRRLILSSMIQLVNANFKQNLLSEVNRKAMIRN